MGIITRSHARIEVGVNGHYKVKRAGSLATLLWLKSILHAGSQPNLDGRIPLDVLLDLLPDVATGLIGERGADGEWHVVTPMDVLHRATDHGLFDPVKTIPSIGEVAPIHDYLVHNRSGAERAAESEARKRAALARHEKAPPTPRDTGSGRFTTGGPRHDGHQVDRAAATNSHGPNRATSTEPTVPTTSSATTSASPRTAPEPDAQWVRFGADWQSVRQALAEREYRLPEMAAGSVLGCPRSRLERLLDGGDHDAVARRIKEAPLDLSDPMPLASLVDWLLNDASQEAVRREPVNGAAHEPRPAAIGPVQVGAILDGIVVLATVTKDDTREPA